MNALDAPFAHYEYSTFARRGRKQRATFTGKYRVDTRRTLSAEAGGWLSLTRHPPARKGTQAAHAGTRILIYCMYVYCIEKRRVHVSTAAARRRPADSCSSPQHQLWLAFAEPTAIICRLSGQSVELITYEYQNQLVRSGAAPPSEDCARHCIRT